MPCHNAFFYSCSLESLFANRIICHCFNVTSQIPNWHFNMVDRQSSLKSTFCVLNVCFACRFTSLSLSLYVFPHSCYFSFVYRFLWCVREAGETCPLHAGSSCHVTDADVRHWRTWWRLTTVNSSACAVAEFRPLPLSAKNSHSPGSFGSSLSVTAKIRESEAERAEWTPPLLRQIVSSSPLQAC